MKIVKGDTVYIRAGKDRAAVSRLRRAMNLENADAATLQERVAGMPMAEQQAKANEDPGVRGEVIRVLPKEGKVVVRGLNMVTKHQKPRATGGAGAVQQGGRIQMEAPLPVSRVMLVCPSCDKPTRVGMRMHDAQRSVIAGQKTVQRRERVCKQCGQVIARPTDSVK
jgi:large subunit ribosomal protein L24